MSLSINRICVRILLPNNKYPTNKSIVIFTANFLPLGLLAAYFIFTLTHSLTRTHPPALFAGWKCGNNALTGRVNFSFFLQKQTNRRAACCSFFRYSFSFSFYFNVKRRPFASIYGIGRVTYGWTHLHFPYFILFMQLTYFGVDFILLNFFFVILRIGWFEYEHLSFYGQFSNKWKSRIEICR